MLKKIIGVFCLGVIVFPYLAGMEQKDKDRKDIAFDNYWNLLANDEEKALESLHSAADSGHPDAAKMLAEMYDEYEKAHDEKPMLSLLYRELYEKYGNHPKNSPFNDDFFQPTSSSSTLSSYTNLSSLNRFLQKKLQNNEKSKDAKNEQKIGSNSESEDKQKSMREKISNNMTNIALAIGVPILLYCAYEYLYNK